MGNLPHLGDEEALMFRLPLVRVFDQLNVLCSMQRAVPLVDGIRNANPAPSDTRAVFHMDVRPMHSWACNRCTHLSRR